MHTVKLYQELNGHLKKRKNEHEAHFVSSQKFEIGESSELKEKELESFKHEEEKSKASDAEEDPEDMSVDTKPTDTADDILKNLEHKMQQDDDDDLLGEEIEDMYGDSV
jgi:Zn finger protein HypA/HybF involved in hydrogenase expression